MFRKFCHEAIFSDQIIHIRYINIVPNHFHKIIPLCPCVFEFRCALAYSKSTSYNIVCMVYEMNNTTSSMFCVSAAVEVVFFGSYFQTSFITLSVLCPANIWIYDFRCDKSKASTYNCALTGTTGNRPVLVIPFGSVCIFLAAPFTYSVSLCAVSANWPNILYIATICGHNHIRIRSPRTLLPERYTNHRLLWEGYYVGVKLLQSHIMQCIFPMSNIINQSDWGFAKLAFWCASTAPKVNAFGAWLVWMWLTLSQPKKKSAFGKYESIIANLWHTYTACQIPNNH